jgi:L-asparaginase II
LHNALQLACARKHMGCINACARKHMDEDVNRLQSIGRI